MLSKIYYRTTLGAHNAQCQNFVGSHWIPCSPTATISDSTEILVQIEASEGAHDSLSSDPGFHTLSLLVAGTPLCSACVSALSSYGIVAGDSMYVAARKLSAISPGLKPTRF
jgi:hypothetical protein